MCWRGLVPFIDIFMSEEVEEDLENFVPQLNSELLSADKNNQIWTEDEIASKLWLINISVCMYPFLFILCGLFVFHIILAIYGNGRVYFDWITDVYSYAFGQKKRIAEMEENFDAWTDDVIKQIMIQKSEMTNFINESEMQLIENHKRFLASYEQKKNRIASVFTKLKQGKVVKLVKKDSIALRPGGDSEQF